MKYAIAIFLALPFVAMAQTTYYNDANGMPMGTAQSPQPIQQPPTQFNAPSAPTFPTSPLFPSSPIGR